MQLPPEVDRSEDRGVLNPPGVCQMIIRPGTFPKGMDAIKYNPNRDLAYNHSGIIANGLNRAVQAHRWPALKLVMESCADPVLPDGDGDYLTSDDVEVVSKMMGLAHYYRQCPKFSDAVADSGFMDLPPAKQVAMMAGIGSAFLNFAFMSRRDIDDGKPIADVEPLNLEEFAKKCEDFRDYIEARRRRESPPPDKSVLGRLKAAWKALFF